MANYARRLGDDITLSITVGTAVNIDNLAELFIYVMNNKTGETLIRFSKAGAAGYSALVKITTTVYEARILSGTTKNAREGVYRIEGNVSVTDAGYESNQENTITIDDTISLSAATSKAVSSG